MQGWHQQHGRELLRFQADSASVDAPALSEFRHAGGAVAAARAVHAGHEARNGAHWLTPFVRSHRRRDSHALQT